MRVLIVKTSSMGDIIHTLPALMDAGILIPGIRFDWVVEENFAEIPRWNSLVENVIPVAIRRWRKNIFSLQTRKEWREFRKNLSMQQYDLIIDAQGLIKSAFITWLAKGTRCGLNSQSARESLAALFYQKKYLVAREEHAITRVRNLFSQALGYRAPITVPDYGIDKRQLLDQSIPEKYLVFLHGTTWTTKHWPEPYWLELAKLATQQGYQVKLPWGNLQERERAEKIVAQCEGAVLLPKLDLIGIAKILAGAKAVVAVDTGLGHLTAALDVPAVAIYGPTNPVLTGALGKSQIHLSAKLNCAPCLKRECTHPDYSPLKLLHPPCLASLESQGVWSELMKLL